MHALHDPARLAALRRTALLDQPAGAAFERLARLAKHVLDVPVTLITLVDEQRQFFVSFVGLPEPWASRRETPLSHSFCQYTVQIGAPFIVENANDDPLVCSNLAIGELGIVAYAGVPLLDGDGQPLGSFAAADFTARRWTEEEVSLLQDFASLANAVIAEHTALVQEQVAQEKMEYAAAVFETTADLVGATTPDGRILYLNRAGRTMLGIGPDADLSGTPLAHFYTPPARRTLEIEAIPDAIRTGVWQGTLLCAGRDGRTIPVVQSVVAHDTELGDTRFLSITARDVSQEQDAVQALRESEQLVRSIINSAGEGIVVYDRELRYLLWNPVMERILGASADEVIGHNALDVFPHLRDHGIDDYLHRALQGQSGQTPDMAYTVPATGQRGWVSSYHSPLRSTSGEIFGVVSIVHEISDRKRAEQALRVSEQRYRTLVEEISHIIWVTGPEGDFTEQQPGWSAYAGFSVDQLRGKGWLEAVHPEDRERAAQAWASAVERRGHYAVQYRLRRSDGVYRHMEVRAAPILDARGAIREWVGIHQDVTEQVEAQDRIALLARERAAILGQIADGVIVTDHGGQLTFVNEAARRIHGEHELGIAVEQYSERFQPITMSGDPFPPLDLPLARAVRQGEVVRDVRWQIRRPDGTSVVVEGSASPVIGDGGERVAAVLTLRDISDRVRAEAERAALLQREREARAAAEHANQAKSDFLTVVSHELRTPLATGISFAELLESEAAGPLSDRQREYVQRISESTWHLTHLVDQILEYTRMEAGQMRIHPQEVDAVAIAEQAVQHIRPSATAKGLAVEVVTPREPVHFESDPRRLSQVLANLLSNAVNFTERGSVRLLVEPLADAVAFRVVDTGIGIAPEHLDDVFSAFWQVEDPLTRRVGGAGLGLSIVRRLTHLLGGEIDICSTPGEGSTFSITLPRRATIG